MMTCSGLFNVHADSNQQATSVFSLICVLYYALLASPPPACIIYGKRAELSPLP